MASRRLFLLSLGAALAACGPPEGPGSTEGTTRTGTSLGASTTAAIPTTGSGGTVSATSDDTDSECGAPGQVRWIRQFDSVPLTGLDAMSVAVDGTGAVILVGNFFGTVDFGGETFVVTDDLRDSYVAKFDAEGHHLWSRHFGGPGQQRLGAVAVDEDGTIALGGRFRGTIDLGGGTLTSVSLEDGLVANLTPDGEHVWSRSFASASEASDNNVVELVVAHGETVFVADSYEQVDFGGGPVGLPDSVNGLVVKLDPTGGHVWSRGMGSGKPFGFEISGVALDGAGDVWVAGQFEEDAIFGDGPPVTAPETSLYVAHYSESGELLDVLLPGSQATHDSPYATALATAADGRVYVGGQFSGQLDFGGGPLLGTGNGDGFLAALKGEGLLWQRAFGHDDANDQTIYDLAGDAAGRTAITGDFRGGIDFGGGLSLTDAAQKQGYVAKLDVDGAPLWARSFGVADYGAGTEVAIDAGGAVYVAGIFLDTMTIDGHTLTAIADHDTVLMKLCP